MQRTKGLLLCFICLLYSRAYVKHLPVKSEGTVSFMLFSVQLLHRDLRRTLVALSMSLTYSLALPSGQTLSSGNTIAEKY